MDTAAKEVPLLVEKNTSLTPFVLAPFCPPNTSSELEVTEALPAAVETEVVLLGLPTMSRPPCCRPVKPDVVWVLKGKAEKESGASSDRMAQPAARRERDEPWLDRKGSEGGNWMWPGEEWERTVPLFSAVRQCERVNLMAMSSQSHA